MSTPVGVGGRGTHVDPAATVLQRLQCRIKVGVEDGVPIGRLLNSAAGRRIVHVGEVDRYVNAGGAAVAGGVFQGETVGGLGLVVVLHSFPGRNLASVGDGHEHSNMVDLVQNCQPGHRFSA